LKGFVASDKKAAYHDVIICFTLFHCYACLIQTSKLVVASMFVCIFCTRKLNLFATKPLQSPLSRLQSRDSVLWLRAYSKVLCVASLSESRGCNQADSFHCLKLEFLKIGIYFGFFTTILIRYSGKAKQHTSIQGVMLKTLLILLTIRQHFVIVGSISSSSVYSFLLLLYQYL
jgi:hypothetical protein